MTRLTMSHALLLVTRTSILMAFFGSATRREARAVVQVVIRLIGGEVSMICSAVECFFSSIIIGYVLVAFLGRHSEFPLMVCRIPRTPS